jgi:hypothetical protein
MCASPLFIDTEEKCLIAEFGGSGSWMIILMIINDGKTDEMNGTALQKHLRSDFLALNI